mmetsp:Transcript_58296/g.169211  ORF Transcript_58296/g.169211 Transcript_58296/m.169211 type:complete len:224 (-) Transcript_58296:418-1089(-)
MEDSEEHSDNSCVCSRGFSATAAEADAETEAATSAAAEIIFSFLNEPRAEALFLAEPFPFRFGFGELPNRDEGAEGNTSCGLLSQSASASDSGPSTSFFLAAFLLSRAAMSASKGALSKASMCGAPADAFKCCSKVAIETGGSRGGTPPLRRSAWRHSSRSARSSFSIVPCSNIFCRMASLNAGSFIRALSRATSARLTTLSRARMSFSSLSRCSTSASWSTT